MDEIGNILLAIWNAAVWLVDHYDVIGLIVGPFLAPVLYTISMRFKHTWAILRKVKLVMKDRVIGDTEAATIFWMLVSVLLGYWHNVNEKVLDYAPDQQVALLKGYKFVDASYRPEVAAVENGK